MDILPKTDPSSKQLQPPKRKRTQRYIKVYFGSAEELQGWADRAAHRGFRRGGLPIFISKPHGFPGETQHNTDGISKYFKDSEKRVAIADDLIRIVKTMLKTKH